MMVALRRDWTNGAMIIDAANMQWDTVHIVIKDGLNFSMSITKEAIRAGGRGVKTGASFSGLLTKNGSTTDMMKVMMENAMSAREPMRPTWPVKSSESLASAGASYRR
jgi:hypothetical protein